MNRKRTLLMGTAASAAMLALILDSRTALSGAAAGVELCLKTVIPSLFPFFVLSHLLTGVATGSRIRWLRIIGKWCGIPSGAESIFLTGLLGGYPVGAQCISQAYAAGQLRKEDAGRMLGFCSNAGPSFLFGMVGCLFTSGTTAFILWCIHILAALIVGCLLPGRRSSTATLPESRPEPPGQALQQSIRAMANVCAWVVLFRVVLGFSEKWFLWLLPKAGQVIFSGLLELSNGCMDLKQIPEENIRFLLTSVFLGFGGVCVGMQTLSVTGQAHLSPGLYFPGKILQAAVSALMALPVSVFLFPGTAHIDTLYWLIPLILGCSILLPLKKRKNNSSIPVSSGV